MGEDPADQYVGDESQEVLVCEKIQGQQFQILTNGQIPREHNTKRVATQSI